MNEYGEVVEIIPTKENRSTRRKSRHSVTLPTTNLKWVTFQAVLGLQLTTRVTSWHIRTIATVGLD